MGYAAVQFPLAHLLLLKWSFLVQRESDFDYIVWLAFNVILQCPGHSSKLSTNNQGRKEVSFTGWESRIQLGQRKA